MEKEEKAFNLKLASQNHQSLSYKRVWPEAVTLRPPKTKTGKGNAQEGVRQPKTQVNPRQPQSPTLPVLSEMPASLFNLCVVTESTFQG